LLKTSDVLNVTSLTHFYPNYFAADNYFHATVLPPPGGSIVVGNWLSLAEPLGRNNMVVFGADDVPTAPADR
jgi:hypothetical protein